MFSRGILVPSEGASTLPAGRPAKERAFPVRSRVVTRAMSESSE